MRSKQEIKRKKSVTFFDRGDQTTTKKETSKPLISFQEYCIDLLADARRIKPCKNSPNEQRYSGAQFELAMLALGELDFLKKENPEVIFPMSLINRKLDFFSGFDWLDLAVFYCDPDATRYFNHILNDTQCMLYKIYQNLSHNFNHLKKYEQEIAHHQEPSFKHN